MILINKHAKLSSHTATMPINDRPLVKQIMLIGLSSAKFLLKGVNVAHFWNDQKFFDFFQTFHYLRLFKALFP